MMVPESPLPESWAAALPALAARWRPTLAGRRLLFVHNDIGYFLSHRLPVAQAAIAAGAEVQLAAPPGAGEGPAAALAAQGIDLVPLALVRRRMNPLGEAGTVAALARLYRRLRPELAHHVTIKPVLYGGLAARAAGVPAVVAAVPGRGTVFTRQGRAAAVLRAGVRQAYRRALAHPNGQVIFQNPDDLAYFVDTGLLGAERAVLIRGSGVDPAEFYPAPPAARSGEPALVLFAARMLWDKGVAGYVEAARRLRAEGVQARFVLCGEPDAGNPGAVPVAQLQAWHAEGAVEWLGRRDDMPALLRQAQVVCLPSAYGEGVPKILIEAAASGVAIVTTDTPGCREIVQHGHNGLLVPPKDTPALVAALAALLADPARCAQFGAAGRARVLAQFALPQVVAQTLALYARLLTPGGGLRRD